MLMEGDLVSFFWSEVSNLSLSSDIDFPQFYLFQRVNHQQNSFPSMYGDVFYHTPCTPLFSLIISRFLRHFNVLNLITM